MNRLSKLLGKAGLSMSERAELIQEIRKFAEEIVRETVPQAVEQESRRVPGCTTTKTARDLV